MRKILVLCLSTLVFVGAVILPASLAAEDSGLGVTRTQIEGVDNWGWNGGPLSNSKITCPGGVLIGPPFDCSDSTTGRLHFRDGACTPATGILMPILTARYGEKLRLCQWWAVIKTLFTPQNTGTL